MGRGPEHHRQHEIGRRRRDQQHLGVHVRVEDAVHHRHPAPRQQPQPQHTPGHGAGDQKEQQRQPEKPLLSAEGRQGQQHPRRQLHQRRRQKPKTRQKHRHGVGSPGQGRQYVPPPPEGNPRQAARHHQQQVVHHRIQHKHAVHIDHRHSPAPFVRWGYYRAGPLKKEVEIRAVDGGEKEP